MMLSFVSQMGLNGWVVTMTLLAMGCSTPRSSAMHQDTVATVDQKPISTQQLKQAFFLERFGADGAGGVSSQEDAALLRVVLDDLILRRILVAEAEAQHVVVVQSDIDAIYAQMTHGFDEATWRALLEEHDVTAPELKAFIRERLLIEQSLRQTVIDRIAILDSDIDGYVLAHPDVLRAPAQVHLKQILVTNPNDVSAVTQATRRGLSLSDAAIRFSHAPEGPQGGDLGLVDESSVPAAMWQHIARLPLRQLSTPFGDAQGTHLFWLTERHAARQLKLLDVRQQIETRLRQAQEAEATRTYLQALKESHDVVIHDKRIKELALSWCAHE